MIKTFTQTDLVRYLYHETTEEENSEIDRALDRDGNLQSLYNNVRETLTELDDAALEPSEATVANILNYSKTLQAK